jgi:2'-5' RNA ligase
LRGIKYGVKNFIEGKSCTIYITVKIEQENMVACARYEVGIKYDFMNHSTVKEKRNEVKEMLKQAIPETIINEMIVTFYKYKKSRINKWIADYEQILIETKQDIASYKENLVRIDEQLKKYKV